MLKTSIKSGQKNGRCERNAVRTYIDACARCGAGILRPQIFAAADTQGGRKLLRWRKHARDRSKYISPSAFATDSGNSMINQMYVQYQIPQNTINQYPIVFVHGCCLTSKTWETTPDGRMGWYEYFTRKGFKTYMGEQVGRGRSGFDALQYQKVLTGDLPGSKNPAILIATDKFAWDVFRWGDYATKTPFKDERFPMETVGVGKNSTLTFYKQVIPDLNATLSEASSPTCADGTCTPSDPNSPFNTPDNMAVLANQLGGAVLSATPNPADIRRWRRSGRVRWAFAASSSLKPAASRT